LTKDEKLVLAHDKDFSRLALDPSKNKKVSDLTMKEIIGLTFKSGTRPPLLLDVLRSAQAIGGSARLVVEIKAGNEEAGTAIVRLFRRYPKLIERCAVIMSFDAYLMHKLRTELNELEDQGLTLSRIKLPELLLLTVAKPPTTSYQLFASVTDFSRVNSWLQHEGKPSLDGVYLQFQPEMCQSKGLAALRALSAQYKVGVWMKLGDPDDILTAARLVDEGGVSYVNTDLPRSFCV
jgi:glycerophosphoryl diester phosphodiesterase